LHEQRVFTRTQLTQLAFGSARSANQRLLQLYAWRVIDRFRPMLGVGSAPMHYVLDLAGAAVLAAEDGLEVATLGYRHDRALAVGHSLRLAHTVGVNGLYAALVAVARHTTTHTATDTATDTDVDWWGGRAVTAWWPETRCARLWGDLVRPDAYARWHEHDGTTDREVEFFLEYDTGTEPLTRVAGKLHDYHRLAAATGIITPALFWFGTPAREATARDALATTLAALDRPASVPVATTAAQPDRGETGIVPDSPAAARWLPLTPADRRAAQTAGSVRGPRVRLAHLTWPGLTSPAAVTSRSGRSDEPPDRYEAAGTAGLAAPAPMPPDGQPAYAPRHAHRATPTTPTTPTTVGGSW
jgi:hypothetical protein